MVARHPPGLSLLGTLLPSQPSSEQFIFAAPLSVTHDTIGSCALYLPHHMTSDSSSPQPREGGQNKIQQGPWAENSPFSPINRKSYFNLIQQKLDLSCQCFTHYALAFNKVVLIRYIKNKPAPANQQVTKQH